MEERLREYREKQEPSGEVAAVKAEAEPLVSFSGSSDHQSFLPNKTLHVLGQ